MSLFSSLINSFHSDDLTMKCSPMDIQEPFEFRRQNLFEFKMKSEKYREREDSDKEELNDEDIRLNKPLRDGRKFKYLLSKQEVKCMAMNISGINEHACKSVNIPSWVRVRVRVSVSV